LKYLFELQILQLKSLINLKNFGATFWNFEVWAIATTAQKAAV